MERLISLSWAGVAQKLRSLSLYTPHIPRKMFQQARSEHGLPAKKFINTVGLCISLFDIIFAAQLCFCWYVVFIWIHLKGSVATIANHSSNKKPWHVLDMCNCPWNSRDNPRVVPVWVAYSWPSRPSRPKFAIGRPETQLLEKLHQSACGWDGYGLSNPGCPSKGTKWLEK